MRQKRSSPTAEGMALIRAIETSRPEETRICYDPIARSLIPGYKFFLSRLTIDSGLYGRFSPGATEFITARERYIEDFLKACLSEGLDQVVILGAGSIRGRTASRESRRHGCSKSIIRLRRK